MQGRPTLKIGTYGEIRTNKQLNGKFMADTLYRDIDGVTRRVRITGKTASGAKQALKDKLKHHSGAVSQSMTSNMLIKDLCQIWIDKNTASQATQQAYQQILDTHISKDLSQLRIDELTTGNLEKYFETKTPSLAKTAKIIINAALNLAVRDNVIPFNYAKNAKRPELKKKQTKLTTANDVKEFLDFLKTVETPDNKQTPLYDFFLLHAVLGARTGETLALRWQDIDLENGIVKITGTVKTNRGKDLHRQDHPKTVNGFRNLKIPEYAVVMLKQRKNNSSSDIVFPSRNNTFISPNNLNRSLREVKVLNPRFANIVPTDFRKAMATFLSENTGNADAAKNQLGHSNISITNKHYVAKVSHDVDNSSILDDYKII